MRINKRKRSIQRYLDLHVIQEAETEAKLEESTMEEEIVSRENQVFENRHQNAVGNGNRCREEEDCAGEAGQ